MSEPTPNFLPHPEAEHFDAVTVDTVERWKESELSGDEWRFSHVATLWHRGFIMGEVYGRSVKDALMRAAVAVEDGSLVNEDDEADEHHLYALLKTTCCQPGCTNPWTVLLHPLKQYHDCNEMQMSAYHDNDVRAFCDEHKMRGDCDCEDNDANYLDVTDRYDPNPAVAGIPDPEDPGDTLPKPVDPTPVAATAAPLTPLSETSTSDAVQGALDQIFGRRA